jgi:uncharacterized protein (TIGR02284 family)
MSRLHDLRKAQELQKLVDALIDVGEGYDEMLSRGEETLRQQVKPISELHAKHLAELQSAMRADGQAADMSGSAMGTVHKTVVAIRGMLDGLDKDIVSAVKRGEKRVLTAYADALAVCNESDDIFNLLIRQRNALSIEIDHLDEAA